MKRHLSLIFALAVLFTGAAHASFNLTDGNSLVTIDPTSQSGIHTWQVNGLDHLFQQWYWFRLGSNPEASIDTISAPVVNQPLANMATVSYTHSLFTIDITYLLTGGAPGTLQSDIAEVVRIHNTGPTPLDFHLFEYSDFDLNGSASGDFANLVNTSTIRQYEGVTTAFVGVVPPANHWEIGAFPSILNKLNDSVATTLSDSGSPFGPGDATFAFQWDFSIPVRGTVLMSKDKLLITPEPGSMIALGTGLVSLISLRRRKRTA